MVNFALLSATVALASGAAAQVQIRCSQNFASRCGFSWLNLGTPSNLRQLQDLVRETTKREPTVEQVRNMVFTCATGPETPTGERPLILSYSFACPVGQCVDRAGSDGCSGNQLPWP